VAHGTRHGVIGGEPTIEKQSPSQSDFFRGKRIIIRKRERGGETERNAYPFGVRLSKFEAGGSKAGTGEQAE
jgi:hypothetical protein